MKCLSCQQPIQVHEGQTTFYDYHADCYYNLYDKLYEELCVIRSQTAQKECMDYYIRYKKYSKNIEYMHMELPEVKLNRLS